MEMMNDNELIAWQVVDVYGDVQYTCLKQSTAEYLRDWCMAIDINRFIDSAKVNPSLKVIMLSAAGRVMYFISETEVIVG
jgi:hypothetical protein